jgi:hypothetical protein
VHHGGAAGAAGAAGVAAAEVEVLGGRLFALALGHSSRVLVKTWRYSVHLVHD